MPSMKKLWLCFYSLRKRIEARSFSRFQGKRFRDVGVMALYQNRSASLSCHPNWTCSRSGIDHCHHLKIQLVALQRSLLPLTKEYCLWNLTRLPLRVIHTNTALPCNCRCVELARSLSQTGDFGCPWMSMDRAFFTGYKQRSTAVDFTPQASYVTTSLPDSVSRHIFGEVGMYAHAVV